MIGNRTSWLVFLQFLHRDFIARKKTIGANLLNYAIIYPISIGIQTAYLQANSYFGAGNPAQNTLFFAGSISLIMLLFTYKQNIELLFDFENHRFIDYQIIILNPFLVLCQRIIFTALYTFFLVLPFYPVAAIALGRYVDMSNASWIKIWTLLAAGSFCLSAYHLLAACLLKNSSTIQILWSRVNTLLLFFGGFWVPWYIIKRYSSILGHLVYLNPCIYITEGIKGALTGSTQFLPFSLCLPMLLFFTCFFTGCCWIAFKRRTDCL